MKSLMIFIVLFSISLLSIFAQIKPGIDIKKEISVQMLQGKSISELRLLKNSILAKYGKPFTDNDLHNYFMSVGKYKPSKKYKDKMLTDIDKKNIGIIDGKISELRSKDYITENNIKKANFNNIYNSFQFSDFSKQEQNLLEKNGFVTLPTKDWQLYNILEENDYNNIPNFISTDLVLQLYYLFFDVSLQIIEEHSLYSKLDSVLAAVYKETDNLMNSATDNDVKLALRRNLAYLAVPLYFLKNGSFKTPKEVRLIIKDDINNCISHAGYRESSILNRKYDFSQFVPRGHYDKNKKLQQYFMAMMWLGNAGIDLSTIEGRLQSVLLNHVLMNFKLKNKMLIDYWEPLYKTIYFYVGMADDAGPKELNIEIEKEFGKTGNVDLYNDSAKVKIAINNVRGAKITGHGSWGGQGKQYRLIGQSYTPDTEIFHKLTNADNRPMPNSLDIMAGFGNKTAKNILMSELKNCWEKMAGYPDTLEEIIKENSDISETEWTKNLYFYWIYSLNGLWEIKDNSKIPFFMTTDGWGRKTLSTALASWSELKNSTILYAKQSSATECGGDEAEEEDWWIPAPPKGYVEPNIEFYDRLYNMVKFTKENLLSRGLMPDFRKIRHINEENSDEKGYTTGTPEFDFDKMLDLLLFLRNISHKELNKENLTYEEYDYIQKFGSEIEDITCDLLYGGRDFLKFETEVNDEDTRRKIPVVTDVHTGQGDVLEVAVGKPLEIYVIVEIDGELRLTRGAVFSFYEFPWRMSDRLTNKKWQQMLEDDKDIPDFPKWTIPYRSASKLPKPIKNIWDRPDYVPSNSTKPGWMKLYNSTGC